MKEVIKSYPSRFEEWMEEEQDWSIKLEKLTEMQMDNATKFEGKDWIFC